MILSVEDRGPSRMLLLNAELSLRVVRAWMNRALLDNNRPRHRWAAQALVAVESALLSPGLTYVVGGSKAAPWHEQRWLAWLGGATDERAG